MGGDLGPRATVQGAALALAANPALDIFLFGPEQRLAVELDALPRRLVRHGARLTLCHSPHAIDQAMRPSAALRAPRDTSMAMMLECVARGRADAGVSAGNTGALMALARRELGMVAGIPRPAISTAIPTRRGGHCYLLDLGANVDAPAARLVDFARLGEAMARCIDGLAAPRVALLNVGVEGTKGPASVREADARLRDWAGLDYRGFVEGGDIFAGEVDVVVCDGFVGNAVLKASEGLARLLVERVQRVFETRWSGRLVATLARPALRRLKSELDPVRYNGASLLGLKGIVVKSHGGASAEGFAYAVARAVEEGRRELPGHLEQALGGLTDPGGRSAIVSAAGDRDDSGIGIR